MGGDLGVEKGAIEFLAPKTPRAPPPGHWRVFARRHHKIFEFLGRRPQNARYFVRLNGAVAPASRRAKTHIFAHRHHKTIRISRPSAAKRTIFCPFERCGGTRAATCENTCLIRFSSTSKCAYSNPRSVAHAR